MNIRRKFFYDKDDMNEYKFASAVTENDIKEVVF